MGTLTMEQARKAFDRASRSRTVTCCVCGGEIRSGEQIVYCKAKGKDIFAHVGCVKR